MFKTVGVIVVALFVCLHAKGAPILMKEREIDIKGRYLIVPVSTAKSACHFRGVAKSTQQQLDVIVDGVLLHSPSVNLAHSKGEVSWWGLLDVSEYIGKKATLRMSVLSEKSKELIPADSMGLELIDSSDEPRNLEPLYEEACRPQLRFSQMRGWNNDVNGALYYDGEYHLFWQANPVGNDHANMYWGHAVSADLIHWTELPEALRPYGQGVEKVHPALAEGRCHSGGGAVDFNNSSGWQTGDNKVLLLTFTDTGMKAGRQRTLPGFMESIAYSNDKGRSWTLWEGNPIIRHLGRDPKLFWYEKGQHWSIAVYNEEGGKGIAFYKSTDLKSWERTGKMDGFYECPEIFQASVSGDPGKKKWVMFGADGLYVIGDFNGKTFVPEHSDKHRFIFGAVYAGQCFSGAPEDRNVFTGWARGLRTPKMPFSQGFTLPLELTMHDTSKGLRMHGYPVKELDSLRSGRVFEAANKTIDEGESIGFETSEQVADILLTVKPDKDAEKVVLTVGGKTIEYNVKSGEVTWAGTKKKGPSMVVKLKDGCLSIRIVVDRPMLEVFFNEGEAYVLISKTAGSIGSISVRTKGTLKEMIVYSMSSIWEKATSK